MKIRSDFVTNSSSSSYVIAYKGLDANHPSILNKMIEIVLFSDGGYETTRGEKVRTIDELDSYVDNDRRKKNRVCVLRFWRSFGEVSKPFSAAQTVSSKAVGVLHETC